MTEPTASEHRQERSERRRRGGMTEPTASEHRKERSERGGEAG
jgi:hypothetical protein